MCSMIVSFYRLTGLHGALNRKQVYSFVGIEIGTGVIDDK
jgi:hypothetical protein